MNRMMSFIVALAGFFSLLPRAGQATDNAENTLTAIGLGSAAVAEDDGFRPLFNGNLPSTEPP